MAHLSIYNQLKFYMSHELTQLIYKELDLIHLFIYLNIIFLYFLLYHFYCHYIIFMVKNACLSKAKGSKDGDKRGERKLTPLE